MKRLRVEETTAAVKEVVGGGGPLSGGSIYSSSGARTSSGAGGRPALATLPPVATPTIAYSSAGTVKVVSEGMQSIYPPLSVSYSQMPSATAPHSGAKQQPMQPLLVGSAQAQIRSKGSSPPAQPVSAQPPQGGPHQQSPGSNYQRLKVEDALSYLDQVKFKFGQQPQVYNDFLDIMKEFKSQSIDTPGVIARVSNLFKGYPELIVGFNTFLPPGYKIEVQANESGYAFQVSVSVPSPTAPLPQQQQQQQKPAVMQILQGSGTIIHSTQSPATAAASLSQTPTALSSLAAAHSTPNVAAPPTQPPAVPVLHHSGAAGGAYGPANSQHNNVTHTMASLAQNTVNQVLAHAEAPQNQPVEFNHAINYVNKIKNRFQGQPEKYKRFLEILHTYQKEQRTLKESSPAVSGGAGKHLTEAEVYSQVAKLFENQDDLLAEFGQFLPDASSHISAPAFDHQPSSIKKQPIKPVYMPDRHSLPSHKPGHVPGQVKRSPPYQNLHSSSIHRGDQPTKKHKVSSCRDMTPAEAAKYGTLHDFAFFDKVRKALRSKEVYENFLRCLTLFNQEIVSKTELVQLSQPFLGKFPELMKWFRDFLGHGDVEALSHNSVRVERPQDLNLEIDLATAKRLGASYCVIPPAQEGLRCSGRTALCKEVLNDQWVSFPTWSEDSTFVSSRKTQYEEYMYRCEDERFELDVVIETNASTIRVLEGVSKKMSRMNPEEIARYRLDDCLGGSSPVLHQRALKRIYGDKAQDIIDGLKRNPAVGVPVVLRRLKAKEEEWREAQRGFNKLWREQNEKYYLKSLDHQGINFKQNDMKALRSKSLYNEIETIFDERHEQTEEDAEPTIGPHLILPYKDRTILDDAANLLIHHLKRQTGVQKGEKRRIKYILRHFLSDLFFHPRQPLSDDEREDEEDKDDDSESANMDSKSSDVKVKSEPGSNSSSKSPAHGTDGGSSETNDDKLMCDVDVKDEDVKLPLHAISEVADEYYSLFMASNNWYLFLRLHAVLCDRLAKIYKEADKLAVEEAKQKINRKESTAIALRLKPRPQIEIEDYYPAFLDMVKNLLDGNMEASAYEDTLREMFGIHAYIAFTLDKVVSYAVRQLQHCVTERTAIACSDLFHKQQKKSATGGACATAHKRLNAELAYQRSAEGIVHEENCYKIYIYKVDCRMTVELLESVEPEDSKKVDEAKKWSNYKDRYADGSITDSKPHAPVYLNRNLRLFPGYTSERKSSSERTPPQGEKDDESPSRDTEKSVGSDRERPPPQRNQPEHGNYDVQDDTQCKFNSATSKIMIVINKEHFMYKKSALTRAKQSHPTVTRKLAGRFRTWLKRWAQNNISDSQHKTCTDWLMGRGEGVVPNRTRVLTNNDLSRSPYAPYNRYRVERLSD